MFHSRLSLLSFTTRACLSHNKANFPAKIYNQFAWIVGVTALLRSLLTSQGRGDGRLMSLLMTGGTNCESLLAAPSQNLRHRKSRDSGTASLISRNRDFDEFDHFNVREIRHWGLRKKDFVIRDGYEDFFC